MKKLIYAIAIVSMAIILQNCTTENKKQTEKSQNENNDSFKNIPHSSCDFKLPDIHFTTSLNGAIDSVSEVKPGELKFSSGAKKDFFNDPNGKLSNNTAPVLLTEIDNTKPFTLSARVRPVFTSSGKYSAGVLYLFVSDKFYQKFCFEQDERGNHRMVTVRTKGTSDDNNHDIVTDEAAYMKISSDSETIACYYSTDNKAWHMVRLYKNDYPKKLYAGISTQSPVDSGFVSFFDEIRLETKNVKDFRMGE